MTLTRRKFLEGGGAVVGTLLAPYSIANAEEYPASPLPDPLSFQSGDFVWPKKPDTYVPYDASGAISPANDRKQWLADRSAFLASQRAQDELTDDERQYIRELSYEAFYAQYVGDQRPGIPGQYASSAGLYVGHVAIIDIDEAKRIWVIEALLKKGVVRSTYEDWLAGRPGIHVWLARLKDITAQQGKQIAHEAGKYLGVPYDFWNFNLNDEKGFYCSKLAWLAVWRSLGVSIDGRENPKRGIWFSPKQMLYAKSMGRLHEPGSYGVS